jgi:glycosyltransferase involved in cell wall biosynthesis
MRVNTIIATHGRPELLERTLQSLSEAELPAGFEHVWVVENGSDAGARKICSEWADRLPLRYENIDRSGKSRALQYAMEKLKDGLAVFFDDDVRIHPSTLKGYAQAAERHGEECVFGGPVRIDYEVDPPQWLMNYLPRSARGWEYTPANTNPLSKEGFLGFNYAVFVQQILEAGGFNCSIGPGALQAGTEGNPVGQETELQQRLFARGLEAIYVPEAIVWHWVPQKRCSPQWAIERAYRHGWGDGLRDTRDLNGSALGRLKYRGQLWLCERMAGFLPHPRLQFHVRYELARLRGSFAAERERGQKPRR